LLSILKGNQDLKQCGKVQGLEKAHQDNMMIKLEKLGIKSAFGLKDVIHNGIANYETISTIDLLRSSFKTGVFMNDRDHETYLAFLAMLSTHLSYRSVFSIEQNFTDLKFNQIEVGYKNLNSSPYAIITFGRK